MGSCNLLQHLLSQFRPTQDLVKSIVPTQSVWTSRKKMDGPALCCCCDGFSSNKIRLYLEFFEAIGNLYIYQQTRNVTKGN